jgi:hypothetical protein
MENNNETELIVTSTHSIKESKGNALGLEGNLALYMIGAFLISITLAFLGLKNKWSYLNIFIVSITPLAFSYVYLCLFHINKPPGYQSDLISKAMNGSDYDTRKDRHKSNPYLKLKRGNE